MVVLKEEKNESEENKITDSNSKIDTQAQNNTIFAT
jgi:hypothetical protein